MKPEVEVIHNAYISIEVEDSALESVYAAVESVLRALSIPFEKSERPHVSIAYTLGHNTLSSLNDIISDIAEAPFIIETAGISIIPGQVVPRDFISLKIKDNDDFLYAQEFVAENSEIKTSFDGKHFIAHISLLTIDKGYESVHEELAQVIEMHVSNSIQGLKLKGKSISVFNNQRELLIQKKM